jgi:hypothetical protein
MRLSIVSREKTSARIFRKARYLPKQKSQRKKPYAARQKRDLLKAHFRRWFFRYFQQWYRLNRQRFALPLSIFRQQRNWLALNVGDIPGSLMHFSIIYSSKHFQDGALNFFADGEMVDHLCWMETYSKRTPAGYICAECHRYGQNLSVFPSQEALWENHIFEVILAQVNNTIAPADAIELLTNPDDEWAAARFVSAHSAADSKSGTPEQSNDVVRRIPLKP